MKSKLKIIYKNINEIKPYGNNPRINEESVKYVINSIKEFGFKNPIIIDKNNVIIAGHTRVKACKKLGIYEIPCIYADDLTDEQVKAYRLVDNKVSEIADWDYTLLDEELNNILGIDMFDLGFIELDTDNIIEGLLADDMFHSVNNNNDKDYFSVSFVFKKEYEEDINKLIKEKGKDYIVDKIINLTRKEG